MKRKCLNGFYRVAALSAAILTAGAANAAPMYTVIDLGFLPGGELAPSGRGATHSAGYAINNLNQVAGLSAIDASFNFHGFITGPNGQGMTDLGVLSSGQESGAYGINDLGQTTGYSGGQVFYTDTSGNMIDLGISGIGEDINNSGQVVGVKDSSRGFVTDGSAQQNVTIIQPLQGGNYSRANAINENGLIAGSSQTGARTASNLPKEHAVVVEADGTMVDLGTITNGDFSYAEGINNNNQVVGNSKTGGGAFHAFAAYKVNGTWEMFDLGTLGGRNSYAYDINDSGQIVGFSSKSFGGVAAFISDVNGNMRNLNNLIGDEADNWDLQRALAINNDGSITGIGFNEIERQWHAFLLMRAPIEWDGTTTAFSSHWDGFETGSGGPDDTNWAGIDSTDYPDANDAVLFGGLAASNRLVVDLRGDREVTAVTFDRAESYQLDTTAGVNTLSLGDGDITVLNGSHTINSNVDLLSEGDWDIASGSTLTLNGALGAGTRTLNKTGAGTVNLAGGGQVNNLAVNAGTVIIGGGTFQINNALSGSGTMRLTNSSALTIGGSGVFSGSIQGNGSLTKTGSGTLTITGASTFTGGTTVTAGTLMVNNTTGWALGSGGVVVKSGATLGGTGSIDGTVQIDTGATLAPGASAGGLLLGSLNLDGVLEIEIGGTTQGTEYDHIELAGGTSRLNGTLDVTLIDGFTPNLGDTFEVVSHFFGGLEVDFAAVNLPDLSAQGLAWRLDASATALSLEVVLIPEPASLVLLGLGGLCLLHRKRGVNA